MAVSRDTLARAGSLIEQGRAESALAMLMRLAPANPTDVGLLSSISYALFTLGRLEQAEHYAARALQWAPSDARAMINLSMLLANPADPGGERNRRAKDLLRRALEVEPMNADARVGVANNLLDDKRMAEALAVCEEGQTLVLRSEQLFVSHGAALCSLGRMDDARSLQREALAVFPESPQLLSNFASTSLYVSGVTRDEIAQAHFRYGRVMASRRPEVAAPKPGAGEADRRLRVAFMSPDLRTHSVAFFVEPLLRGLDREEFEVLVYHLNAYEDQTSARLRTIADRWQNVANLSHERLLATIRKDRVDVLVDLAGHTFGHRLAVLAVRAAPVQVTYCGYPDTTGLPTVDYRIVDSTTDPREATGAFDRLATEKLWRLDPCFLCYAPPPDLPAPAARPAGPVFGCFNSSRKFSATAIGLWARVLRELPGARMVLKSQELAEESSRGHIRAVLAREGVSERVEFLAPAETVRDHLGMYGRMDVALDTFPYCGTTTTCEALWMGVPVVTLAGDRHAARVGASLLSAVGLPELIAHDEDAFVRMARDLSADVARLDRYRSTLRAAVAASPLCDAPGFARRFGQALRAMWRERCGAGGSPQG